MILDIIRTEGESR